MKKSTLAILLAFIGFIAQAQIPNGYYNNAANKTGDDLKIALHNIIIQNHKEIGYANVWTAFWSTDNRGNNEVWDMYSDGAGYTYYYYPNNSDQCGTYSNEGDCYNREHSWPQSWFGDKSKPKCDMHHIYPTDGKVNGMRSNYPYGEVKKASWTSRNGSKLGTPKDDLGYTNSSDNKVFEPIDEYKGDIARGLFYMSVRYYNDDTGWGTSGMTNKSEILPWAMTMLLRWSDNDPVSQKEIDRNNAVYEVQKNRNPFIDHPEYARMIWDPNYNPASAYTITYANNLSNGSVSGPASANEGTTVAIIATPAAGYTVNTYSVYKTDSPSTTVSVSSNGTFTMPGYAVTVSATFTQNTQLYTITKGTVSHGSISISATSALSGATVTMTATPVSGYSLYSWYVYKTSDMNTIVTVTNPNSNSASFTMPAFNVTVMASFVQGISGNGDYVKVTSEPSDWSGEYLIVYETGNKAFDGSLTTLDATNNTISVTITGGNTIASSSATNAAKFAIASMTGGYSIKAGSGKYIGNGSNSNGLTSSNDPLANTLEYNSNGYIDIVSSGGSYLRYNSAADQQRFRYFKSSTYTSQQLIQLYKKTSAPAATPTHSINFNPNGGSGTMDAQNVDEMVPTALIDNAFSRNGFEFSGWNTAANGTGTYYADGATVTLLEDLTLYAQWDPLFTVTCATGLTGGTINASPLQAVEGATITLTATPNTGYELDHWTVTYGQENIDVENNQFDMPAGNVNVSATFVQQSTPSVIEYVKVTEAPSDWSGEYLIVCENQNLAFNGSLATLDAVSNTISVSISSNTIEASETTNAATFTIAAINGGYSIQSASGKYIGQTSDANGLQENSITVYTNTISFDNGNVNIVSGGAYLRYNSQSGQTRFRYFKSSTYSSQQPIQFYKKVGSTTPDPETPFEVSYHLVTSTDQLVAGRTYLIVNENAGNALSKTQNSNNRAAAAVSITDHTISTLGDACELTLGGSSGQWTLYDATNNNGYLYAAGGTSNNYLKTQSDVDNNATWAISFDEDYNATIKTIASGNSQRNIIRYNNSNTSNLIFSCYASGQQPVQLYIRSKEHTHTSNNETIAQIFSFDKHIVRSGITLTVTGTATCNDPNNLIIEDGAQFVHHNSGVQATFKKGIQAYTEGKSDGWYTIASPFISFTPGQVAAGSYDLYAYVENSQLEWYNYRTHQNSFPTDPYKGYLYAHNPAATLRMTGTLNNGDYTSTVDLSYANNNADLKGYNLLGNPTAHEITFSKTASVSDGYYYLSNSDTWIYEGSCTVPAGRGFLVKANATGQKVTLNPSAKRGELVETDYGTSQLKIDVDGEQAYVKLTEGVSMPLLSFRGKTQRIFLERDDKAYVMLVKDDAETIRLNYQPNTQDQHKLSVSANELELDYLHLTDRLTGADIDLLVTPSYSFESNENDPVSRFLLRFSPIGNEMEEDAFAYYADGKINIMDVTASATLQIIDLTGRVIVSKTGARTVSTDGMTSGIYTVRLITPENVRTQKIIIN